MPYPNAMAVKLNHAIVHSVDKRAAADFFAGFFRLPAPQPTTSSISSSATRGDPRLPRRRRHGRADAALRLPGEREGVRPDLRPHQGARSRLLGRSRPQGEGPDQPPLRRPRRLLPGPERPPARDHYETVRQRRVIARSTMAHSPSRREKGENDEK